MMLIHPGRLQIMLQWLADHTGVLYSDGRAREELVSHFSLKNSKTNIQINNFPPIMIHQCCTLYYSYSFQINEWNDLRHPQQTQKDWRMLRGRRVFEFLFLSQDWEGQDTTMAERWSKNTHRQTILRVNCITWLAWVRKLQQKPTKLHIGWVFPNLISQSSAKACKTI